MVISQLLILQLIAHILADYTFQTNKWAEEKNKIGFRSKYLKWHVIIVFVFSYLLSFQLQFVLAAAVIAVTHFIIDGIKPWINENKKIDQYSFFVDQIMHIGIIIGVVHFYPYIFESALIDIPFGNIELFSVLLAFLICTKPANILIKEIFDVFDIHYAKSDQDNDLPNAGSLIGIVERLLVLTFVFIGEFQAVGFLIAAKSILRFKDDSGIQSEYVLIGTMLSFAIAIFIGISVQYLW